MKNKLKSFENLVGKTFFQTLFKQEHKKLYKMKGCDTNENSKGESLSFFEMEAVKKAIHIALV
jgi:hypothetical protein